jgi:hypothetical protein
MVYLLVMLLFYCCTSGIKNNKFRKYRGMITKGLVWNSVLSFLTESYMLLSISSVVNFTALHFEDLGTAVSSNMTVLTMLMLIGFPIFSFVFMILKRKKLVLPKTIERFGVLYENLKTRRINKWIMFEPTFALYRMLLLTFVLINL